MSAYLCASSGILAHTRKVYYRLYEEDGPIDCKGSFHPDDPCLGRISVIQVSPPHTAKTIKRALRKAEGIPETSSVILYSNIAGDSDPLDDPTKVAISSGSGPGSDPHLAMALKVIQEKPVEKAPTPSVKSGEQPFFHPLLSYTYKCSRQVY